MVKIPVQSACNSPEHRLGIFEVLNEEEYARIKQNKIIVKYKPNETIIKQNSRATQALIVIEGFARVQVYDHNEKDLVIRYLKKDDFFGISGLYTDNIYTFSISALEECTACFIDYDLLGDLVKSNIRFSEQIIKLLSEEKIHIHNKFLCLTQKQTPGRAANAILYLNNEIFKRKDRMIIASRNDIAALTGMTNDNAGRILKDFTKNKLIKYDGKYITILDIDKLENIRDHG